MSFTIEQATRFTIMSGPVVMYSTTFASHDGAFGLTYEAAGAFEVSASREAVVVHRAELHTPAQVEDFLRAVHLAEEQRRHLAAVRNRRDPVLVNADKDHTPPRESAVDRLDPLGAFPGTAG